MRAASLITAADWFDRAYPKKVPGKHGNLSEELRASGPGSGGTGAGWLRSCGLVPERRLNVGDLRLLLRRPGCRRVEDC